MSCRNVRHVEHNLPRILVIGTVDTKLNEVCALATAIEEQGGVPVLLDSSGRDPEQRPPSCWSYIDRLKVAKYVGLDPVEIAALPRGEAITALRKGVLALAMHLYEEGEVEGAICLGGAGTYVTGPAFAALPIGFPKMVVSPLASGGRTFEPYVGLRDVVVMHSVADICGINGITREIFRTAAGYIVGAALSGETRKSTESLPNVAVSMNGNTTAPLMVLKERLESLGFAFVAFHANGVGGRALESFVEAGMVSAVIDFTTTELSGHEVGGLMDSGATRMEAAGKRGIPQILVPGCLDFITCAKWDAAAEEFPGRSMFMHNPELTLVRLTEEEMAALGVIFARKANASMVPVTICVPRGGLSVNDRPGGVFWNPEADTAFVRELQKYLSPRNKLVMSPAHITDPEFVEVVWKEVMGLLAADSGLNQLLLSNHA